MPLIATILLLAPVRAAISASEAGPEPGPVTTTWYIDAQDGDDARDGRSPDSAKRSLSFTQDDAFRPVPGTRISLRRGRVFRPGRTLRLKGHDAGWVVWGAYGTGPKPILAGSVAVPGEAWSPAGAGLLALDWSAHLDADDHRSPDGVEQGPGNLWFFANRSATAPMSLWGWRRESCTLARDGDWFYDARSRRILLRWQDPSPPPMTEAAVNRVGLSFAGQKHVAVEDWDLRYIGGYVLRGHAAAHVRMRRLDMSFTGGGTKNGSYCRMGNGMETNGVVDDILLEGCRIHQVYDTGFDPQDVGNARSLQSRLSYRGNLVSHAGLAGIEFGGLRTRQDGTSVRHVACTGNVIQYSGRGWGYEQHDHRLTTRAGYDICIFESRALIEDVVFSGNVFRGSRGILMCEWLDRQEGTRAQLRSMVFRDNLWQYDGRAAVVLFKGVPNGAGPGMPVLGASIVYPDLGSWQASAEAPGMERGSRQVPLQDSAGTDPDQDQSWIRTLPPERRPTRFGPFALLQQAPPLP